MGGVRHRVEYFRDIFRELAGLCASKTAGKSFIRLHCLGGFFDLHAEEVALEGDRLVWV